MFHQVFICNTTEDPDDSRDPILEQNSLEDPPQILNKQECTTSGSTSMGYVQTEYLKMAVEELKSEQYTVINNQIFTKTDIQASQMGLDTKDFLKVTPDSNTSSPAQMIIQQPQQTSVILPLGPTDSCQPPVENIVLEPQPTLVSMNGNLVQLSALPATPVINAGLPQSPTVKIEPSFSLSNVGISEELKSEKTVTTSSHFKFEREESMEDALPDLPHHTDSGDAEVLQGAVKFQECNGAKNSILRPKIRQSGAEKREEMCSATEITDFVSKVQFRQIDLKSQNYCENKRTKISDNELRMKHDIKECTVVINSSVSKYLTSETVLDNNLGNELEFEQCSSASDREENHTDVDVSSDSDWEEEYLAKSSKSKKGLGKRISKKTVNSMQSMNLTNHSMQPTNESCFDGVECSFEEENKISSLTTSTTSGIISENDIYKPPVFTTPQNNSSSQNYTTKGLLTCNTTYNTGSVKVNSEECTFPPKIFVKTTIENVRSLKFIPLNPINVCKSNKEVIELKQKNKKNSPHMAQRTRNDTERLTLENSILKPKTAIPGSDIVGVVDTFSLSTPTFSISGDNHVSNAKSNQNKAPKKIFQLKLPFQSNNSNMKFFFMPQNKIANTTETQIGANKNIPARTVIFTKSQPFNADKKVGNTLTQADLKQKNDITSPHKSHNSKKFVQKTVRKILPKPRIAPSSSQPVDMLDMPLYTTPPSQDDCDEDIDEDYSSKIDQRLSEVSYHTYHCNKCDKYFEFVDQYLAHTKYSLCGGKRREAKHQCDICGKCFTGRGKLEGHKNAHTNARPFKCFDCDKCFNSKNTRHIHHQKMHLNKKTRYLCCFCGYICPSSEHLLAHEEEHRLPEGSEAVKPFKCLVCGKGFISRWKQQRHKKEHESKKCSKCSEQFQTYTQLRNHMEVEHSIIKTCSCKECGKQFKDVNTLRNHHKTHSSVLLYSCDICDKGFKRKGNLRQHMITHSDERPISCPECGESFKRITHLKQHSAAFHGDGRK